MGADLLAEPAISRMYTNTMVLVFSCVAVFEVFASPLVEVDAVVAEFDRTSASQSMGFLEFGGSSAEGSSFSSYGSFRASFTSMEETSDLLTQIDDLPLIPLPVVGINGVDGKKAKKVPTKSTPPAILAVDSNIPGGAEMYNHLAKALPVCSEVFLHTTNSELTLLKFTDKYAKYYVEMQRLKSKLRLFEVKDIKEAEKSTLCEKLTEQHGSLQMCGDGENPCAMNAEAVLERSKQTCETLPKCVFMMGDDAILNDELKAELTNKTPDEQRIYLKKGILEIKHKIVNLAECLDAQSQTKKIGSFECSILKEGNYVGSVCTKKVFKKATVAGGMMGEDTGVESLAACKTIQSELKVNPCYLPLEPTKHQRKLGFLNEMRLRGATTQSDTTANQQISKQVLCKVDNSANQRKENAVAQTIPQTGGQGSLFCTSKKSSRCTVSTGCSMDEKTKLLYF